MELRGYFDGFRKYSNLLKELVKKGIVLKYRRSYLGILWTMLEPVMTTFVLAIVFGGLFNKEAVHPFEGSSVSVSFTVYILTGRLLYTFFSQATKQALRSIRNNAGMIKKVYVPKYLYPLSSILYTFVIFLISLIVLVIFMIGYRVQISWHIFECIIPIVLLLLLTFGIGLILSTGAVFFRDLEYLWDVALMIIMYASAIFYDISTTFSPEKLAKPKVKLFKYLLDFNPLYSIIKMFRSTVIFQQPLETKSLIIATATSLISVVVGLVMFNKQQDKFILHI